MTVTRLFPSGGYEIIAEKFGRTIRFRYFGYTRREAIAEFRADLKAVTS